MLPSHTPLCRLCDTPLRSVLDLGASPPCQLFLRPEELDATEPTYPLHLRICPDCLLLQVPTFVPPEDIFREYAYFSSFSEYWVDHARTFVQRCRTDGLITAESFVVEVASNDGYLLQHVREAGIRCLGIEPSLNVGAAARDKGIEVLSEFLTAELGDQVRTDYGAADLVIANNVYAHIPDVIGFGKGLRNLVSETGRISIEVHYAKNLVLLGQFDTIYHEHFQYYTVTSAQRALAAADLALVDVEFLPTHGGSLRLWAARAEHAPAPSDAVLTALADEAAIGLDTPEGYLALQERTSTIRDDLLSFLIDARRQGLTVVGYGAPSKANTLLNYCGIRPDLLAYTVDRNPYKQGLYTPGTRIPCFPPEQLEIDKPDIILILPWNLADEISTQLSYTRTWGARLFLPLPTLEEIR